MANATQLVIGVDLIVYEHDIRDLRWRIKGHEVSQGPFKSKAAAVADIKKKMGWLRQFVQILKL